MQRLPDWDARLAAYLEEIRACPFAWGRHDCCTFGAGAVLAMTGVDPMPEFRGRYRTQLGSVRALKRFGAGTLDATLDTKFVRVAPSLAQRGDLVMSAGAIGVVWNSVLIAVGSEGAREGLIQIERVRWVDPIAWRVPFEG